MLTQKIMKFIRLLLFPAAGFLLLCLPGCRKAARAFDPAVDRQLVEKAIRSSIGWAKNKDTKLLYSVIANDKDYLEVDPEDNVVRGFDEFRKAEKIWLDPAFRAVKYEIRDLKIGFSQSGEVAWFYCVLDDINEWKGRPASWENTRWTGVLEKRSRWVIVQMHFSFAATE